MKKKESVSIGRDNVRGIYECIEITEDHILLRYVTRDEVIGRLGENKNLVTESSARQLLGIVTNDQALKLIQHYG